MGVRVWKRGAAFGKGGSCLDFTLSVWKWCSRCNFQIVLEKSFGNTNPCLDFPDFVRFQMKIILKDIA